MHVAAGSELDGLRMFEMSTQTRVIAITRRDTPVELHPRRDAWLRGGDTVYLVINGKVKITRAAVDGRENLLAIMGPGDIFGELSLFDPGPRTASASALSDVDLASLEHAALRPWLTSQRGLSGTNCRARIMAKPTTPPRPKQRRQPSHNGSQRGSSRPTTTPCQRPNAIPTTAIASQRPYRSSRP